MKIQRITALIAITLCLTACGPSESDFKVFSVYKSPDGNHLVEIDSAHSELAFGPETIRVFAIAEEKGVRHHIVTTKIANDGGGISEANISQVWIQPEVIRFCLSGAEQGNSVLEINVPSLSYTEEKRECD